MTRHRLSGTDLSLSTFCCGLGDLFTQPEADWRKLLDAFVEAGGNFFDTAHAYCHWLPGGNGLSEITIGEYVRQNGLRDAVIATKGGHHSAWRYRSIPNEEYLAPGRLAADLDDSLARLERETIDLYYLHRDDPRVPVGEIMDFLAAERDRGRIRFVGASNWSAARLAEAQAWAARTGRPGFVITSSLWSLASLKNKPVDELPYPHYGTVKPEAIRLHETTGLAMAPYTPTAKGYFDDGYEAAVKDYGTGENEARRTRVRELAHRNGVTPTQVALGWLLSHPFPVFPVLGTKQVGRLLDAVGAETIRWTPEQCRWLSEG